MSKHIYRESVLKRIVNDKLAELVQKVDQFQDKTKDDERMVALFNKACDKYELVEERNKYDAELTEQVNKELRGDWEKLNWFMKILEGRPSTLPSVSVKNKFDKSFLGTGYNVANIYKDVFIPIQKHDTLSSRGDFILYKVIPRNLSILNNKIRKLEGFLKTLNGQDYIELSGAEVDWLVSL